MLNDFWEDVKGLGMVLACSCGVSCQPAGGRRKLKARGTDGVGGVP